MINPKRSYLLIHQGLSVSQLILAGFVVLLVAALFFLLLKKLKKLRYEAEQVDKVPEPSIIAELPDYDEVIPRNVPSEVAFSVETPPAPIADHTTAPVFKQVTYDNGLMLSESGSEINAILNSLSDIIFEYDENKVCINLWYNKAQNLIVDLEMFRGKTVTEAMGPERAQIINDALDFVATNGVSTTVEFLSFFGSGKWFQSHISPVFDAAGNFTGRTTSSVTDISEHKKYALALKEKQQQLLEAQKIARLGDWWYDLNLKQTGWSDNLFALLEIDGLPPNTSHFEYYISRVQADDRRAVYQFFNDLSGENHQHNEHKILTANNNLRYFRIVRGEPLRNEQGNINRLTGIIQDITETRVIERTIKKSKAELLEAQTAAKIGSWKWYLGPKKYCLER
jgi:two-component system sensor histidine kinase/response regulator